MADGPNPTERAPRRTPSWRPVVAATAIALLPYAWLVGYFDFVCDDAFISFRYAKHLAQGLGPRYNLGSAVPVEGYTNFLWVLLMALVEWLRGDVTLWSRVLSVTCGVGLVALVVRSVQRNHGLGAPALTSTALFLVTLPTLAVWSTGGLETMPTTLALFAVYERLLGDRRRPHGVGAGLCAALAVLLRPDSVLYVGLFALLAAVRWARGRDPRLGRAILLTLGIPALCLAAHVTWRYGYYHELLPHTARVKMGFGLLRLQRGLNYALTFLVTAPSAGVVLVWALALRGGERLRPDLTRQGLLVCLTTAAYGIGVGGDFMSFGRFALPALPFLAILAAGELAWLERTLGARRPGLARPALAGATGLLVGLSLLAPFDLYVVPEGLRQRFHFRWNGSYKTEWTHWTQVKRTTETMTLVGRALALFTRPGESIIVGAAGALAYHCELKTWDTVGLTNRLLEEADPELLARYRSQERLSPGHDTRVDPEFFLHLEPTYLGATVLEASRPPRLGFPKALREAARIERHPLPVGRGFPAGMELRVLRRRP